MIFNHPTIELLVLIGPYGAFWRNK